MNKRDRITIYDLIKYRDVLSDSTCGDWRIGKGEFPHVSYSRLVDKFIQDVTTYVEENPKMELCHYGEILNNNGLAWEYEAMKNADLSQLDTQCVMALIVGAIRAERFCDGILLRFIREGYINKWLEHLAQINGEIKKEVT